MRLMKKRSFRMYAKIEIFTILIFIGLFVQNIFAQNVTLGYRSCGTGQGTCHEGDGKWWKGDAHFETIKALKAKARRSKQIAQLYGVKNPSDYIKGNSPCASCHGEVVTKRKNKNMNTGVSCERCHGPAGPKASGYFEVHKEGDPSQDTNRSGYKKALRVGLVELRNVNKRAVACVSCHYINDKKLLEAGHPTGETFNYVRGIENAISKHWDYAVRPTDKDKAPYEAAIKKKGPIPTFEVTSAGPVAVAASGPAKTIIIYRDSALPPWLNPKKEIEIEPFNPQTSDSSSIEAILLEIKNRIEYLHKAIGKK